MTGFRLLINMEIAVFNSRKKTIIYNGIDLSDLDAVIMNIQKMVDVPGRDLGMAFIGGAYLATYARIKKDGSWNTTINAAGRYEAYNSPDEIIELAHRAQEIFNLDFTSVDVVETEDGPLVFEVSDFGGFRGLLEGNKIYAAELYAGYVVDRVGG